MELIKINERIEQAFKEEISHVSDGENGSLIYHLKDFTTINVKVEE